MNAPKTSHSGRRPSEAASREPAGPVSSRERVVAVTGAGGFIGGELIKRMEVDRRYRKVIAFDIREPDLPLEKTRFHMLDLTLPSADAAMRSVLVQEDVDTMVHAAFPARPPHAAAFADELEDVGTRHVLAACAAARVAKFILASTTLVYGARRDNPNFLTENRELPERPRLGFVAGKLAAEHQVRRFRADHPDVTVTVLRAAPTLGPTADNVIARCFRRPIAPVMMGHDPMVQLVHEEDVIDAFRLALEADHSGEFNVVGEGVLPYTTVLAMMGKLPVAMPSCLARPVARALWMMQVSSMPPSFVDYLCYLCVADGKRARDVLGFRPRHDIRATIRDFLGLLERSGSPSAARGRI